MLPVIAFHADISGFGGSFVGVDVFFVISGYLITSIFLAEQAKGSFSLLGFYERRARRLLRLRPLHARRCPRLRRAGCGLRLVGGGGRREVVPSPGPARVSKRAFMAPSRVKERFNVRTTQRG
jgi:hypothetical protein